MQGLRAAKVDRSLWLAEYYRQRLRLSARGPVGGQAPEAHATDPPSERDPPSRSTHAGSFAFVAP